MEIRRAGVDDVDAVVEITLECYEHIEDKSWFFIEGFTDYRHVYNHLENEGRIYVCVDEDKVVGYFVIRFPRNDPDNRGIGVYSSDDELYEVANMEITAVKPGYRGCKLMCQMIDFAEKDLPSKYRHFLATVHPDNYASLGSLIRCGFSVIGEDDGKYGAGFPRLILRKERYE